MAFKRRLTAQGPAAAYDTIMSSQDRNTNQSSSGISRIPESISGGRVRISSSEGHEWSMHGPANKDPIMNLGDTGANQSADEPDEPETESARQSTFMRFQQFCRPVNWAQMNPTVLPEPEAESARQSPYMRFQSQVRPVDRPQSNPTVLPVPPTSSVRRRVFSSPERVVDREESNLPQHSNPSGPGSRPSGPGSRPRRRQSDDVADEGPRREESNLPQRSNQSRPSRRQSDDMPDESPCRQGSHIPDAFERLHYQTMIEQVKEYKQTVANLQRVQTGVLQKIVELPRHCRWECVSKVLTDVVSSFLLGSDAECTLYPSENQLIPRILQAFGVGVNEREKVEQFFTEWGKGGQDSIMGKVFDNIRDRRGAILRVLREEFYLQLGTPKPRDGSETALGEWRDRLTSLRRNREWRSDSEGDKYDPWGTPAIHHCIARVLKGIRYDRERPISISVHQAGFFFHNLELAMEGRVMEASRMHLHHRCMREMEESVIEYCRDMRRIHIIME